MKSLFLGLGIVLSLTSVQAEQTQTRGGQAELYVKSAVVADLDQNQLQCEFQVSALSFLPDVQCGANFTGGPYDEKKYVSCLNDLENATFVAEVKDGKCTVQVGQIMNATTNQYYSDLDSTSLGLFTWIQLNTGYSSLLMFPNYGK